MKFILDNPKILKSDDHVQFLYAEAVRPEVRGDELQARTCAHHCWLLNLCRKHEPLAVFLSILDLPSKASKAFYYKG